jgi:acyl-CoA thioesterase
VSATASAFDAACRSTLVAPGVYERTLDRTYWGHESQFGGYAHALILQAMVDEVADPEMVPVSASVHFIRPYGEGRFRCEVDVVRRGRTMSNVHARTWSEDKLVGQAIATFARRRDLAPLTPLRPPPELASPVAPGEAPTDPRMSIPNHRHFEMWPRVGSWPERRADVDRVGGWVRMIGEPIVDERVLVMINDLWPPVAYHRWTVGHVAVSADITTQFRGALPAAIAPGEPVFVQLRTVASAGGFVDEDTEVWTADGTLLCQGRQMRFVHA